MRDPLATTYNDASVLENFHISEAFKVLYDERTNILDGLSVDEMRLFRQFIIKVLYSIVYAVGRPPRGCSPPAKNFILSVGCSHFPRILVASVQNGTAAKPGVSCRAARKGGPGAVRYTCPR